MKQAERQERSRREILQAAMEEFGSCAYEEVTVDRLCSRHKISKGMLYHYYSGKEELFLLCVEETFQRVRAGLEPLLKGLEVQEEAERIKAYFHLREEYFSRHPLEKKVFENAFFRTPEHLKEKIQKLRQPLRELNRQFLEQVFSRTKLRPELTQEKARRYIEGIEYVFWALVEQYRAGAEEKNIHSFFEDSVQVLDMVLFGLIQQPDPLE